MIFTQLVIDNLGVYGGQHTFDLRLKQDSEGIKPLILFGGKNGAGKTTILEAIRLCLYGQHALGSRVRRIDYQTYLHQRIHHTNQSPNPASKASVKLAFEHIHNGQRSHYEAIRSWFYDTNSIQESVAIYKNDLVFHEIAPEHWNDFLRDLIPQGVSDLFFFDGEQIQDLARDDTESEALTSAIRGLLGFDLVERLQNDLNIYLKQQYSQDQSNLLRQIREIDSQYEVVDEQWGYLHQDRAQIQGNLTQTESELQKVRDRLSSEGGFFISRHNQIEHELKLVNQQISDLQDAIRSMASGLLPFAVTPQWIKRLEERLHFEESLERSQVAYATQQDLASDVTMKLLSREFQQQIDSEITPNTWGNLAQAIQSLLVPSQAPSGEAIRHSLAAQERQQLFGWMEQALEIIPDKLHQLSVDLERAEKQRTQLNRELLQIPDEEAINPFLLKFNELSERKGQLNQQLIDTTERWRLLGIQRSDLERQRQKLVDELATAEGTEARIQRAAQVQLVLREYLEKLTIVKIADLEQQFVHFFNLLSRKRGLIKEVKIDPKRFTVTLYRQNRIPFAKSELSAGEKQLYAMALLWALRSVSGRSLPIIVDTPMGRLDSDHRQALFNDFFPLASHQMIVLSTDTEVSAEMLPALQDCISHTFLLDFDQSQGRTVVYHDYFQQASSTNEVSA